MNYMIDGDNGAGCFSPYHNPDTCISCKTYERELKKIEEKRQEELEARIEAEWDRFDKDLYNKIKIQRNEPVN